MKPRLLNSGAVTAPSALFRGSRMFNDKHELNAGNVQDALKMMASFLERMGKGEIVTEQAEAEHHQEVATMQERREMLAAAYHDNDQTAWTEIGATIAAKLYEVSDREGFMRNLLTRGEVMQGQRPRFEVRVKQSKAVKAVGPAQQSITLVRDKYIETDEFQIKATPFVSTNDLNQGQGDLLDYAYLDSLEQIFRVEDQTLYNLLVTASSPAANNSTLYMSGAFSNLYLGDMILALTQWNVTAATLLFAQDIMMDILTQGAFADNFFDPVSKLEIIQTGRLGSLLGMQLVTDSYRHPMLRVLNKGDIFALGAPEQLGAYTDRGPVTSVPLGPQNTNGTSGKGWYMEESIAVLVHNARAVAYGSKIS